MMTMKSTMKPTTKRVSIPDDAYDDLTVRQLKELLKGIYSHILLRTDQHLTYYYWYFADRKLNVGGTKNTLIGRLENSDCKAITKDERRRYL